MNTTSLLLLGRQPAIGLAELESLYGADNLLPYGDNAALLDVPTAGVFFARLGGSTRLCKVLDNIHSSDWPSAKSYLTKTIPVLAADLPEGKLTFGVSVIGIRTGVKDVERVLLDIKKVLKQSGRSARIVPNKQLELNSAQVIHNRLTSTGGLELVVVSDGQTTIVAQTTAIQDIEGYAARDQARPYRDARVGMLPPKLAQVIVNLATGSTALSGPVLDPFCGTGVTLQEASLAGYDAYGSDLEPRMVDYSIGNLHWLRQKWTDIDNNVRIELGDAMTHKWQKPIGAVAAETYLGAPLTNLPSPEALRKIIDTTNGIHEKFLRNIAPQLEPGTQLCLAVPAWSVVKDAFVHLPVLDHLKELGYNEVKFVHVKKAQLIYYRENQFVARALIVIKKD